MPQAIGSRHDHFMLDYFQYGVTRFLDKTHDNFLISADGHVIPVRFYITLNQSITDDVFFIGLFRIQEKDQSNYIVFSNDGVVNGATEEMKELIGLEQDKVAFRCKRHYY
jgi:hypothetical protein